MASLLALGQFYLMREDCLESHGLYTFLREASQWRTLHFLGPSALKHLCRMLDSRCPWVKQQLHCFRRHVDGKNHYLKTSSVLPRAIFLPSLEAGIDLSSHPQVIEGLRAPFERILVFFRSWTTLHHGRLGGRLQPQGEEGSGGDLACSSQL